MKWKIISMEGSAIARRLGVMFGMEMSGSVEGKYDGLIFISVGPWHIDNLHKFKGVPKILYWTGTDVRLFLEDKKRKPDFDDAIHVTDSPGLISKLGGKIPLVYFLPMPPYLPVAEIELERPYGILIYITRHVARDVERTKAVIKELPNIPIYVLKGQGVKIIDNKFQKNIVDFEWICEEEKRKLFRNVSVYLRLMNFDGLSQLVIEMKSLGRHVFYTNPTPFCDFVVSGESSKEIARRVLDKIETPLDMVGAEWYKTVFSKENFSKTAKTLCAERGWDFPYE